MTRRATDPGFRPRPDARRATPAIARRRHAGDPVEHLWNAAHEFLAARRAVIDAADAVVLDQQRRAAAPARAAAAPHRCRVATPR